MRRAEIVIIGGGVMGSALARELARSGRDVVMLEKAVPGAEASSAAAGILGAQAEAGGPGPFMDLCLKSRGLYEGFAAALREETGVDICYRRSGLLKVAFDEQSQGWLDSIRAWQREAGLPVEVLSGDDARRKEPALSPEVSGALYFADDGVVDNRLLVQALFRAAVTAGVRVISGETVRRVRIEGGKVRGVEMDGGPVDAPVVCLCAGSWSSLVPGTEFPPDLVQPVRGQMLAVRTPKGTLGRVVFTQEGYAVPRDDGRIIAGSTMEMAGFEKQVTVEGLHKLAVLLQKTIPASRDAEVIETWAGLRPCTADFLPVIGRTQTEGLFISTGHFRNGILLTPVSARLLRQLINGETPDMSLEPFSINRFDV